MIMKKLSKIIIAIVLSVFGLNVARAASCPSGFYLYDSGDFKKPTKVHYEITVKYTSDGKTKTYTAPNRTLYKYILNRKKDGTGKEYVGYCRNPGREARKSDSDKKFSCDELVFDQVKPESGPDANIYWAGITEIFKQGYNGKTRNSDYDYFITQFALRTYEMMAPNYSSLVDNFSGILSKSYHYMHVYVTDKVLNDDTTKAKLRQLKDTFCASSGGCKNNIVKLNWRNIKSVNIEWSGVDGHSEETIIKNIRTLVNKGLDAAIDYKKGISGSSITWKNSAKAVSTGAKNAKAYQYEFTLKNFKSSGSYAYLDLSCPDCKANNVKYNLYINDSKNPVKTYADSAKTIVRANLLNADSVTNGTGKVKVIVEVSQEECNAETVEYFLKVKYSDAELSSKYYDMHSSASKKGNVQSFYFTDIDGLIPSSKDADADVDNKDFRLCEPTCEQLEKSCNVDKNEEDCKLFEEKYESSCSKPQCEVRVENGSCSSTGASSAVSIKEGYEISGPAGNCTVTNKLNVKECIINNEDPVGNSYEVSDNRYCKVYCKEDYKLSLPGNQNVDSGRYFQLTAKVTGSKTCYTSKINTDKFLSDLEKAGTKSKINSYVKQYSSCTDLNSIDYKFDPTITFKYEETGYYNIKKTAELEKGATATSEASSYCSKDTIDNNYTSCGGSNMASSPATKTKTVSYTDDSGTHSMSVEYDDVRYVTRKINKTASYKTPTQFATLHDSGTIVSKYDDLSGTTATELENGLPVRFNAKGTYDFSLTLKNVGEYFETQKLGRLIGGSKSVLTQYLEDNTVCKAESKSKGNLNKNGIWTCKYSIDDRPYYCETSSGEKIDITECMETKTEGQCIQEYCPGGGGHPCPPPMEHIDLTNCLKTHDLDYCVENNCKLKDKCPPPFENVDISDCLKTHNLNYCIEHNCPDEREYCPPPFEDRDITECVAEEGREVCVQRHCCPDCPTYYKCQKVNGVYYGPNSEVLKDIYSGGTIAKTAREQFAELCKTCDEPDCPQVYECLKVNGVYYGPAGQILPDKVSFTKVCKPGNGGYEFDYRSVTTSDLNPNNRELGSNWQYSENVDTAEELKAKVTTEEIIEDGEKIYDLETDNVVKSNKFAMKIHMTSGIISHIREENEKIDTYVNGNLTCYDYNDDDGNTYSNIMCYSDFIDDLVDHYSSEIKFGVPRPRSKSERNNGANTEYWTLWTEAIDKDAARWSITTTHELAYFKTGYGSNINVGPSWK